MDNITRIKAFFSAVFGLLTALWGWFGWLIIAWAGCMALDVLTGMAAGAKAGEWSSQKARDGLWHKTGCVASVIVAGILDLVVGLLISHLPAGTLPFTYTVFLCPLVVSWYILTEAGSITENACKMGAPVPSWLTKTISALKNKVDNIADDNE